MIENLKKYFLDIPLTRIATRGDDGEMDRKKPFLPFNSAIAKPGIAKPKGKKATLTSANRRRPRLKGTVADFRKYGCGLCGLSLWWPQHMKLYEAGKTNEVGQEDTEKERNFLSCLTAVTGGSF
ncbi:hypothetical protein Efla_007393 [Eimeria flavescens]